jgi:hypothetical protein
MRTTVDLPPPLFRRAKARAAARGETLRTLLTRAVTAEVGGPDSSAHSRGGRVTLPLFGTPRPRKVRLSHADVERALAADEAAVARRFLTRRPARR